MLVAAGDHRRLLPVQQGPQLLMARSRKGTAGQQFRIQPQRGLLRTVAAQGQRKCNGLGSELIAETASILQGTGLLHACRGARHG